jgi:ABC-2 type transport system permease protein
MAEFFRGLLQWLRQVRALSVKEFLTLLKDPRSRFAVLGPPIIQFFVFGYAATFEVVDVPYAIVDQDRSTESRDLLARFEGSENFQLVAVWDSIALAERAIDHREVRMVLHVEDGFAAHLREGRDASVQLLLDGRDANVSGIAGGYVREIVASWANGRVAREAGARAPEVAIAPRAWFNPARNSRWFIVSGLPAQLALVVVMLVTSLSVAREREQGTFDQTLIAPVDATQILVAKSLPAFVFGVGDGLALSAGAVLWFGVPLTGSITALVAVLSAAALAILGVGLFISSLSATMQQGLLGAFLFIMPAVILSGFTTPIENMPDWLQAATYANPARYSVAGCRAVFLEGAGLGDVLVHVGPMLLIAAFTLTASGWLFRARSAN